MNEKYEVVIEENSFNRSICLLSVGRFKKKMVVCSPVDLHSSEGTTLGHI